MDCSTVAVTFLIPILVRRVHQISCDNIVHADFGAWKKTTHFFPKQGRVTFQIVHVKSAWINCRVAATQLSPTLKYGGSLRLTFLDPFDHFVDFIVGNVSFVGRNMFDRCVSHFPFLFLEFLKRLLALIKSKTRLRTEKETRYFGKFPTCQRSRKLSWIK